MKIIKEKREINLSDKEVEDRLKAGMSLKQALGLVHLEEVFQEDEGIDTLTEGTSLMEDVWYNVYPRDFSGKLRKDGKYAYLSNDPKEARRQIHDIIFGGKEKEFTSESNREVVNELRGFASSVVITPSSTAPTDEDFLNRKVITDRTRAMRKDAHKSFSNRHIGNSHNSNLNLSNDFNEEDYYIHHIDGHEWNNSGTNLVLMKK